MHFIEHSIPQKEVDFYRAKAEEKIAAEGWQGRNKQIKTENFVNCWVTEEAFKKMLIRHNIFFRHRGLYVGDAAGAGVDFEVKRGEVWVSVGIRSIGADSLEKWKSVAYPEDRFLTEKHKIPDHVVACINNNGTVRFVGMIDKMTLLAELDKSKRLKSTKNQEWFRTVPLEKFSTEGLCLFLEEGDERVR